MQDTQRRSRRKSLASEGTTASTGHQWHGNLVTGELGSRRVHITSEVCEGPKGSLGRKHTLRLTADQADKIADEMKMFAADVRHLEARDLNAHPVRESGENA